MFQIDSDDDDDEEEEDQYATASDVAPRKRRKAEKSRPSKLSSSVPVVALAHTCYSSFQARDSNISISIQ